MLERNQIYCMDAFELMAQLPDNSVDMVLTDMPYNITACEWESKIDLAQFWLHVRRIVKPKAAVVCTASQPFTSRLVMSNILCFRHEWIWEKSQGTGYLNANRAPMKSHENILAFALQAPDYYPQLEKGQPYRATRGAVGGFVHDKTVGGYTTENNGSRYPKTILHYDNETGLHPTQKPVALFEYLIRTYTQAGDLVLDPFIGSGTTAIAARNLGRQFIGCDLSQEYVDIANKRLAQPYNVPLPGLE